MSNTFDMAIAQAPDRLAYNYRETGQLLGVCDRTVWGWVNGGRLRAMKCGGTVRISREAIIDFIHQHENTPAAAQEGGNDE
ncbi:MAG: helix-turn-helix domain-containing protein [Bacillota bacterium]